jgi:hypothetical protein
MATGAESPELAEISLIATSQYHNCRFLGFEQSPGAGRPKGMAEIGVPKRLRMSHVSEIGLKVADFNFAHIMQERLSSCQERS